ncbi:DUF4166 domain-containing protein [Aeromicrobium phragmitis]|uniref:DUF4166 domain-containing protein n=1 Tax=Aeromicrobium phragmitis TaxID=2478914 RepID=A0A3L8PHX8_9ACTN|nr:DUF4166 domain-containing protein [Aeromicrobium phragmitis]RLV54660.1 DUF4166 domain-containing protein [Aeromicrobium phragmitis]
MTSIFGQALGSEFARLHPALRRRFGLEPDQTCLGRGVMRRVWRGPAYLEPFLRLGTLRNILFPESGWNVPFTIENHAYVDGLGRETVSFVRTFDVANGRRRRFDATMIQVPGVGVVDFLGTHQHLAVALDLQVVDGALDIRSRAQAFVLPGGRSVALPLWATVVARVRERYDDEAQEYVIDVRVEHPRWGPVFGYDGRFVCEFAERPASALVMPYRERAAPVGWAA